MTETRHTGPRPAASEKCSGGPLTDCGVCTPRNLFRNDSRRQLWPSSGGLVDHVFFRRGRLPSPHPHRSFAQTTKGSVNTQLSRVFHKPLWAWAPRRQHRWRHWGPIDGKNSGSTTCPPLAPLSWTRIKARPDVAFLPAPTAPWKTGDVANIHESGPWTMASYGSSNTLFFGLLARAQTLIYSFKTPNWRTMVRSNCLPEGPLCHLKTAYCGGRRSCPNYVNGALGGDDEKAEGCGET